MDDISALLAQVDSRARSNTKRIDRIEARQDSLDRLVSSVSTLANEQEHIKSDVIEIKSDVKTLTAKPAKRWDAAIDKTIWAIVGGVAAYILAHIGM